KEIQRQYKDFEDRASLLYDLMGDEQDYAMAADDQNIANWKAQRDLGMATSPGGYYATPYQNMTMSEILRPSLPDYVRPDYRLNGAVGLPGPQGFDDPDYTSWPADVRGRYIRFASTELLALAREAIECPSLDRLQLTQLSLLVDEPSIRRHGLLVPP
ncbi:MAG: hypothetical protein IPL72_07460, partial [Sulfuritalea sp.]|nr:hypothetical protein [Sulfuritalea sp.]